MSEDTLSKTDIEKRINDWILRISNLYSSVKDWLNVDPSYTTREQTEVIMYEEMMQKYQLPPRKLKVLDIYQGERIVATLKPIGLWIIGVNGRIDLLSKDGAILLVDKSEQFHTPNWICYTRAKKDKGAPFDRDHFLQFLGELSNEHI